MTLTYLSNGRTRTFSGVALALLMLAGPTTALAQKAAPAKGATDKIEQKKDERKDEKKADSRGPRFGPIQNLKSELALINQRLDLLTGQVSELRSDVDDIQNGLQAQINAIQATLSTYQGQLTGLQGRVTTLEGTTASLQGNLDANTATITAINTAVASLTELLTSTQTQLQAAIATQAADTNAIIKRINDIQLIVDTNNSQIQALEQQNQQINALLQNIANGRCVAGQAIQEISDQGMVTCTTAGASSGALSTVYVEKWGNLRVGSTAMTVSCPAGYVHTGSGFYTPTYYETMAYVSNVGYTTSYYRLDWYYRTYYPANNSNGLEPAEIKHDIPVPEFSYLQRSPLSVTSSHTWPSYAGALVTYTPQTPGNYVWAVYANCLKIQ